MDIFKKALPELLQTDCGRYVLVKGKEVIGTFDTWDAAVKEGYKRFFGQPFLAKKIEENPQPIFNNTFFLLPEKHGFSGTGYVEPETPEEAPETKDTNDLECKRHLAQQLIDAGKELMQEVEQAAAPSVQGPVEETGTVDAATRKRWAEKARKSVAEARSKGIPRDSLPAGWDPDDSHEYWFHLPE